MTNHPNFVNIIGLAFCTLLTSLSFTSCSDEFENPTLTAEEVVPFLRLNHTIFLYSRANAGNLKIIGDRLYFSNPGNPGFFDLEGNVNQFSGVFDIRYGHTFSEKLAVGVWSNRKSLYVMPSIGFASNYATSLTFINIPNLPIDAQLQEPWFEQPNFAINDNFLISSWHRDLYTPGMEPFENTFILELNLVNTPNSTFVDLQEPILRKIPIDIEVNGMSRIDLISAFTFEEGWIVSGNIAGIQNSFYITKEGKATPIRSLDERFVILSLIKSSTGELFLTTETELFYAADGDIFNLVRIASSNQFLRVKLIQDRMVTWAGRDNIYEITNFTDSDNIGIRELENLGLEGLWVKDVELFNDQIYVATNGGLFLKDPESFWTFKEDVDESAEGKLGWSIPE